MLLTDAPLMLQFDLETLAVSGPNHWNDNPHGGIKPSWVSEFHAVATGSAHPVPRPGTETWVAMMLEIPLLPFGTTYASLYTIDGHDGLNRTLLAKAPMKGMQYFHSYGVSEHYVVLPCNMKLSMPSSKGRPHLLGSFEDGWDGIHVVGLDGKVQVFETDPFYHVHVANTFENKTGIVMDLGAAAHMPFSKWAALDTQMFLNKTVRDQKTHIVEMRRYHIHLEGPLKGQVTWESLAVPGRSSDFFKINEARNGWHYCIYYATEWFHDDLSYASMAILKHDICRGVRTYWSEKDSYPGEPFFVPREEAKELAEDDGLVVFVTLNGTRRASDFVVLNGTTFQLVTVVPLPVHIPFTAHGQFLPAAAQMARKAASVQGKADIVSAASLVV